MTNTILTHICDLNSMTWPPGCEKQADQAPDMSLQKTLVYFEGCASLLSTQRSRAELSALFTLERSLGQPCVNTLFTAAQRAQAT